MPTPAAPVLIVLTSGTDIRFLGTPLHTRNARVAARYGARLAAPDELARAGDALALVVPPGVAIDRGLFPLPSLTDAQWLEGPALENGGPRPAVLAGPAGHVAAMATDRIAAPGGPRRSMPEGALFDVSTPAARRAAEWWLLRRTSKPTDGWISRRLNRPISQAISYVALRLGMSAHGATLCALLVGLAAALVATLPGWAPFAVTGFLFHAASVLDGVDGEIARTTLTESERGARFDAIVDRLTAIVCFAGVVVGWAREGAGANAIAWTVLVMLALGLSLWRAFRFVAAHSPGAPLLVIDGAIRRAAAGSGAVMLRAAARGFALLRRDLFAVIFMLVGVTGIRALVPVLVALGIVIANVTFAVYGGEIARELRQPRRG